MKSMSRLVIAGLVATSLGVLATPAFAQRGGGRGGARGGGGGMRGGGGGMRGGMSAPRPSFNRTPSFTPGGGVSRSNPGGYGPMRPSTPGQRPNFAQPGATRPGAPGSVAGGNRPSIANVGGRFPGGPGAAGYRPPTSPGYPGRPGGPGGRPPGWGGGPPPAWAGRPGWNNHQSWVNGYWHGRNSNNGFWNNGGAFWTGMALGGIAGWGINSAVYNWGYRSYVNPYAVVASQPVVIQQPVLVQPGVVQQAQIVEAAPAYDYSQPLQASTAATEADPALQTFDDARAAFKAGDYGRALQNVDEVLKTMPNDAAAHEFRALCLFALKQYDQAAGVLYAVLSVGPGWDWTTMIGLYPNVDVYTAQLRELEGYRSAHPDSAPAHFVAAYHYLTAGFEDAAAQEFREVARLQPADTLSKQIAASLSGESQPTQTAEVPQAAATTSTADEPSLVGVWKAAPDAATTIDLTLQADGSFVWNVVQQGKSQPIAGTYTYGGGVLTLVRTGAENDAMVGRVSWKDASHFLFHALGGGVGDAGLEFAK